MVDFMPNHAKYLREHYMRGSLLEGSLLAAHNALEAEPSCPKGSQTQPRPPTSGG
jgi:hypothetical protein